MRVNGRVLRKRERLQSWKVSTAPENTQAPDLHTSEIQSQQTTAFMSSTWSGQVWIGTQWYDALTNCETTFYSMQHSPICLCLFDEGSQYWLLGQLKVIQK